VVLAIDARRNGDHYEVVTHGGRRPTGIDLREWLMKGEALGAGEILLTSMDRDGTKVGYDLELLRVANDAVNVPLIASGGVGSLADLVDGVVLGHADAVLAASIFHLGTHTISEAKAALAEAGCTVRPDPRQP